MVRPPCDGEMITAVVVRSVGPAVKDSSGVLHTVADVMTWHHVDTRTRVVMAYVRLREGHLCTDRDRSESERLLRLLPFIASASVQAIPDGPGRVRIEVETVDEIPLTGAISMDNLSVEKLALGSENAFGQGLTLQVMGERGLAYRNGIGANVVEYGAMNAPYTIAAAAERDPLGGAWSLVLAKPFLTDLERTAFHSEATAQTVFYQILRPVGDPVAMSVRRTTYDVAAVSRIGSGSVVGVLGPALLAGTVDVATQPDIVSDSGLIPVPVTADSALGGGYPASRLTRLAALGGLRALHFVTVTGFDALTAAQDVGEGVQFAAVAAPSVLSPAAKSDVFVSGDVYAGVGNPSSFLGLHVIGEGRSDRASHDWNGVVVNSRLAWYAKPSDLYLQIASLDVSELQHLAFPQQLTFQDHDGGLPGYPDATYAGGQRAVVRLEERRLLRPFISRADAAVGVFADAGKLWAGDAPYGVTTGVHSSVGISLLSAFPAGGKRTYRLDFAVPLNRPPGGARYELRLSSADRTQLLWQEPSDVSTARSGAAPANLLSWSPR